MFNLRFIGRTAVALFLGAGLYVSAGIDTAAAGITPIPVPGGLIHSEGGFDFSTFDSGEDDIPFFVDGFAPIPGGGRGVLGICPGCSDDTPNVLEISRPDGALFSMTGLVGSAFGLLGGPPIPEPGVADFPAGVDFAVFTDLDGEPVSSGVLAPGVFEFHAISTGFVSELFILSPLPFDDFEPGDCLCFDSMDFLVDFDDGGEGDDGGFELIFAAVVPITVTFGTVPEPAAFSVLGLGLVGLALMRRHRQTLRS